LASVPLGRIVFTQAALPAVQPVNFMMAGDNVIIRTSAGSKLAAAVRNSVVAFEVDDYDAEKRLGWSVVIVGHARRVSGAEELGRLRGLPLRSWAPGGQDDFIRITPEVVTGRRIPVPVAQ
jgi:nitroimidazol reductase NimA-like FMN-containing flavoprotein (pyridoxamine 5'-phosphate oxidase superfamily)